MAQTHERLNPFEQLLGFVGRAGKQRDTYGLAQGAIKGLEGASFAPPADLAPDLVLARKIRQDSPPRESESTHVVGAWSVRRWRRRHQPSSVHVCDPEYSA